MTLAGTRPPTLDEWEKYERHHRARLAIKPGITGMWQVSGRSDIEILVKDDYMTSLEFTEGVYNQPIKMVTIYFQDGSIRNETPLTEANIES